MESFPYRIALRGYGLPHQSADWFAMTDLIDIAFDLAGQSRLGCGRVNNPPLQKIFKMRIILIDKMKTVC